MKARIMSACAAALRLYTRLVPFHRGRGVFVRLIELLKRRGWPAPLVTAGRGLVMEFEPSLVGWTLFERGEWEPRQTETFLSLVRSDAVVFNIGANTGYYTLLAAATASHVYAFEMQPAIAEVLRRNIARNGLEDVVTVVEAGCFSSSGEAAIEHRGDPGAARIRFEDGGTRVRLITLDEYVQSAGLDRLDVILIDAEGADFEILKGAAATLERFRPAVIAEVHHLETFGGSERELCEFMSRFGYIATPVSSEFSRDLVFVRPASGSPARGSRPRA
ncbi:MAG TPA: FkbM family methyltransferase [Thermoanaerobaculia bacterium]|nr:FkbM family methyltransferase [Thermoanaerobaculia bacterium]